MSAWVRSFVVGGALLPWVLIIGCAADSSSSAAGGTGWGPAGTSGGGSSSGSAGGSAPTLVVVDANRTMTAQPGEGVGVFSEYVTGGHWHVWWTCDTNVTGFDCNFDVTVSVASGTLGNPVAQGGAQFVQTTPSTVRAVARTSTGADGFTVDAPAGAVIRLDAKLNDAQDGSLLFFVQDGIVNGGYTSPVADPLMLEPSSP